MSDWLKIVKDTPDKPEVGNIAARLKITPDDAFGKLFRVWAWLDTHFHAGQAANVDESFIDRLAGKKRFAAAMRAVGWLSGDSGALVFPNADRHNGRTAKDRAVTAVRVENHRSRNATGNARTVTDVTPAPLPESLPEREVEKEKTLPTYSPPPSEFAAIAERIANRYPRRERVREAITEIIGQLRKAADPAKLAETMEQATLEAAAVIKTAPSGANNKYTPSPLTFFRDCRYLDDPTTLVRAGNRADGRTAPPAADLSAGGRRPALVLDLSQPQPQP